MQQLRDVLAVYLQHFWMTVRLVVKANKTIRFTVDRKEITYTMDMLCSTLKLPVKSLKNPFIAPSTLKFIQLFLKIIGYQGNVDKDYYSIKDDVPLVSVYTTGNVTVKGMLIADEFLTYDIRVTPKYKETPNTHRTPTSATVADDVVQKKKRKQVAIETEMDEIAKATLLSLALHKTSKIAEEQENMEKVQEKIMVEDVEKIVEGENEESYASEFADSVFLNDKEDSGTRLELRSHKENPKIVDDDDEEEKKDDMKDDDNDNDVHDDHALIKTQIALRATNDLIEDNLKRVVTDIIMQERDSLQAEVPALSKEFADHAPKIIEELFNTHMQNYVIIVHPTTSTSTAPTTFADLQQQLYMKMKRNLQDQADDLELWDVLKPKFEKYFSSHASCRDDTFRNQDHDDHQEDDAPLYRKKRAKIQKTSKVIDEDEVIPENKTPKLIKEFQNVHKPVPIRGEQMDRSTGPDRKTEQNRTDRIGPNVFWSGPRSEVLYQFGLRSGPILPKTQRLCRVGPDRIEDRTGPDQPVPDRTISVWSSVWRDEATLRVGYAMTNPKLLITCILHKPTTGLIYLNNKEEKMVMYLVEIVKFCDATLERVLNEVKLKIFETEFLKKAPLLFGLDLDTMKAYEKEITKRPRHQKKPFRQRDDKKRNSGRKYFRCGDPNHLIGECPKPLQNKDQKAFAEGCWSDSENEVEDKTNDETCFMAQSSNEVTLGSSHYSINASSFNGERDGSIMHDEFEMSMMGELNFFLGLQIKPMEDMLFFNQPKYIKKMLKMFGLEDSKPTKMQMLTEIKLTKDDEADSVDNTEYLGIIDLSKNFIKHSRTKHIEIRHDFLRDNVQKGNTTIEKVTSEDNLADILTKPLKREQFNYLRLRLKMMEHIPDGESPSSQK
nr:retrovirus-related Pol polyprotein from transposon TNT 1-94 [Tanacetum cinerariifolium]